MDICNFVSEHCLIVIIGYGVLLASDFVLVSPVSWSCASAKGSGGVSMENWENSKHW
jgi:hypothetical protein